MINADGSRAESVAQESFKHQKMIKQFAQTLIFIVLIFVASFFRDAIKNEKIKKRERAELAAQIARQNYLLERERFLEKHKVFLESFLEYEDHCNKIHALIFRNPSGLVLEKVIDNNYCISNKKNCLGTRKLPVRIQMGDRTPLDFALIYVFLASLMFLFVRAVIDVSKEFNAPHNENTEKTSLHDYASTSASNQNKNSSRRSSSATPKSHSKDTRYPRLSFSPCSDNQQVMMISESCLKDSPSNETCAKDKSRRCSVPATMAHHILKDTIDVHTRRQSESFSEEDEHCGADGKKHRLIRR
uniref:CSON009374 protein n=1 Tax=Culicoides sonorensis TaxID=179676 RepID=A0A336MXU0_CULSO